MLWNKKNPAEQSGQEWEKEIAGLRRLAALNMILCAVAIVLILTVGF